MYLPAGWRPSAAADPKYRIGFSQVTTVEPWRVQFNKDIKAEAAKHPNVELLISDGQDKTEKQVADVETFIAQQVDLILISPKELAGLTGWSRRRWTPRSRSSCSTATSTATAPSNGSVATMW